MTPKRAASARLANPIDSEMQPRFDTFFASADDREEDDPTPPAVGPKQNKKKSRRHLGNLVGRKQSKLPAPLRPESIFAG